MIRLPQKPPLDVMRPPLGTPTFGGGVASGRGKYAIVKLRAIPADGIRRERVEHALAVLLGVGVLEFSEVGSVGEFFVMRLRDVYAQNALSAYSTTAHLDGEVEYAAEVRDLAARAGPASPFCKKPD